jgi:hypothetical protein
LLIYEERKYSLNSADIEADGPISLDYLTVYSCFPRQMCYKL